VLADREHEFYSEHFEGRTVSRAGGKAQWVPRIGAAVVSIFALVIIASPLLK